MKRLFIFLALACLLPTDLFAEAVLINLRFEPTSTVPPSPAIQSAVKSFKGVMIQPFTDKRKNGDTFVGTIKIGTSTQMIESKIAITAFASDAFRTVYEEWGGKISPNGPLVLKGDVTQFAFDDYDGYQARVSLHFYLTDSSDKILWDGHSSGIAKGSGKSVSPESLSGIFSDILRATYNEMLEDEKLVGIWSGRVSNTYLIKDDDAPSAPPVKNSR
jgi:hypothetical protein